MPKVKFRGDPKRATNLVKTMYGTFLIFFSRQITTLPNHFFRQRCDLTEKFANFSFPDIQKKQVGTPTKARAGFTLRLWDKR